MAVRSEYAQWRDEIEAPKLTLAERVARWFDREPKCEPVDVYAWHDVGSLIDGGAS
jgi:hypothetical protein